jgi:outer membrane receptor protein involved in Fe transport
MVYALFSDGFRAGGRNVTRPNVGLPADYEPDFLDNYELGFKSRWAGGKYTFNLTAFKMKWDNYQVEVVAPPENPDDPVLYAVMVTNVGDAEIEGLSLEFAAFLWDSLDFGLNLQTLDPRVTEGNDLVRTRTGDRLPFSPEEKGAVWAEYTFPGELAGGTLYSRIQWTYTGNMLSGVSRPRTLQPAYQITDFRIGLEADAWEIYAYVDNLTDERAILFDQRSAPPGTISINWPRTWGIGFSKSWGPNN